MKKNHKIIYITLIMIVILSIIGYIIWKNNNNYNNINKIQITKTTQEDVKTNGVYITDVSDIVDEVMPSIVAITSKTIINNGRFLFNNEKYTAEGAGSGVIISESDDELFILTNNHVVENTNELTVSFIDNKSYDATIKGISERKDIAIVSVKKSIIDKETLDQIKIAKLGNSNELKVGNGIIAIGNALGYGQSVTTGVVSALNREVSTDEFIQDMIQIDAAINGGNSGGALLNNKGEVVGINSVKYSTNSSFYNTSSIEGMGFAIPISDVNDIINKLMKGENDTNNLTLGIEGYMTNNRLIANYELPDGLYISSIISGGNASKSELEIGNIITEIDNQKITSVATIRKVLNKKEKGDEVVLKVKYVDKNEYKKKQLTIQLN